MNRAAQSFRAVLEYVLLVFCILAAGLDLNGIAWAVGSFSNCSRAVLLTAPIALLLAALSVFVSHFRTWWLVLFGSAIGASTLAHAMVSAGGLGICSDPIRVNVGLLPYLALILLVGRIVMLKAGPGSTESNTEVRGV